MTQEMKPQIDWYTPVLENSAWTGQLDRELRKNYFPMTSTRALRALFDELGVQTFRDFFALDFESVSHVPKTGKTTWEEIRNLQKQVFDEGPEPWSRTPTAIPVPGLPGVAEFGSLAEFVQKATDLLCGMDKKIETVLRLYMGLLNVDETCTLEETGNVLELTKERIRQIADKVETALFNPRLLQIDDICICARKLFENNDWKLAWQTLAAGLDQAFGWTGTTAYSVRQLLHYCGIELVDLPGGQGVGWNEEGRFDGERLTEAAYLSAKRKEAIRTVLEEAGPKGLELDELISKCQRRFPDAEFREGVVRAIINNDRVDLGDGITRMIQYERGTHKKGGTRISLNTFFLGEDEVRVLQEAAASIRTYMELTGLGIVSIWRTWRTYHGKLPVDLPLEGFYMMLRDIDTGMLNLQVYPFVSYPSIDIKKGQTIARRMLYEYCSRCDRKTATYSELRTFLVDSLGMEPQLASTTISNMKFEKEGAGRNTPLIVSPPDSSCEPANVFLPAIDNFRDFSLARQRGSDVTQSCFAELQTDGRVDDKTVMSRKVFVCIHGMGLHPGGRKPGFSSALRQGVEALLGPSVLWKEVLWDDLLAPPASFDARDLLFQMPVFAQTFYEGREGDAIRARVADAVHDASQEAKGAPVVLVGHSFGAAIAYDLLARGLAPEVGSLVMLAAPMGLFNAMAAFPDVKGDRLPEDLPALSLRSDTDWFAEPLGGAFPDVSEREVLPPSGTCGSANHRFYWASPDVAESVAAAAVKVAADEGEDPATAVEMRLLDRAMDDSLWCPAREILDEEGNIVGITIS